MIDWRKRASGFEKIINKMEEILDDVVWDIKNKDHREKVNEARKTAWRLEKPRVCGECHWWREDSLRNEQGMCYRRPEAIKKCIDGFCGEWVRGRVFGE